MHQLNFLIKESNHAMQVKGKKSGTHQLSATVCTSTFTNCIVSNIALSNAIHFFISDSKDKLDNKHVDETDGGERQV
jgi:hypothetical protein